VQQVASAAHEGVQELRPGDRVAIMTFNTKTRTVLPFTDDMELVQRSIREDILSLHFSGGTLIQNAVFDAAKRFLHEPRTERRRAVLIITDDMGQRTRRESTVVTELWEADALLTGLIVRGGTTYTVQRINRIAHPYLIPMQAGVRGIAEKTGGDFIQASDPAAGFPESMRRIRTRYSLYYPMPEGKPGTRHAVRVELAAACLAKHPNARVRARTGYLTPSEEPSPGRP
jgi:VWFA-related protein